MFRGFPYLTNTVRMPRNLTEELFPNILCEKKLYIFRMILEGYFLEAYIGLVLSVILNLVLLTKMGGKLVQGKENTVTEENAITEETQSQDML